MKNGSVRFDFFLNQLQVLFVKSSKQKNPALWLYQNNARTPLFMLEALAKLYAGIHNKKKFSKLKEQFKLLEDAIGSIDYYDSFAKEFAENKQIPSAITSYIQAQSREKIQSLNEILKEKDWLGDGSKRIEKIRKKLAKADWQKEKDEIESIYKFYTQAIKEILNFINKKDFNFENVESDVHELRRKLRWLSIYPQALRGSIQLSNRKLAPPKYMAKYLTKEITSSPYNVMPDAGEHQHFLVFDKNRFYTLSWMIAELGKLKDNGLRVEVLKEAILQTASAKEKDALNKAYNLCGAGQLTIEQILLAVKKICITFCKEKNLEALIIGTGSVKK